MMERFKVFERTKSYSCPEHEHERRIEIEREIERERGEAIYDQTSQSAKFRPKRARTNQRESVP